MTQTDVLKLEEEFAVSSCSVDTSDLKAKLPETLRQLLAPHTDTNEWLMALLANITVSGGLIPEVWTIYDGRRIFPMLMLFVVCPPASGKGTVGLSGKLLERINQHLLDNHKTALLSYQQAKDMYRASLKTETPGTPPVKPKRAQLLVPGNITSSKLIQQAADNERVPLIMVETEADVLSVSFKNEHGALLSTLIRQAYHHERISLSRRKDDEQLEIDTPKMSMVLTGTDSQIMSVFKGNHDGLFSRFMFLRNTASIEWRSGKPVVGSKSLDKHYTEWSERFFQIWQQSQHVNAEVTFTDSQWDLIDESGRKRQVQAHSIGGNYAISIARRHSLMVVRMATILSFFRQLDPASNTVNCMVSGWVCDDVDVELALLITEASFQNSLELFREMPVERTTQFMNTKRVVFFNALPEDCDITAINQFANMFTIPERTKTRWIKEFCDIGILEKVDRGLYKKTSMAAVALMAVTQATDN